MSGVTAGGKPWGESRQLGENGPTMDELNRDCLAPLSREHGYDLCVHPFSEMIDFTGLTCGWCGQPVTEAGHGAAAKALRTQAILAAYPHLARAEA